MRETTITGYLDRKPVLYDDMVDEGEEYVVSYDVSDTSSFGSKFHVVQYGLRADIVASIFLEGSLVRVRGRFHRKKWKDKSGRTHDPRSLEALEVELLSLFGL